MKKVITALMACLLTIPSISQQNEKTRIIFRSDDIGSFQAANDACIMVYREGISRSVEVMVNCPWFPEAARLLRENPGYDVGVHLTLTSEWENYKWRPLTHAPSLVDSNGYFYPMIWKNDNFPTGSFLREANWKIEEIEKEFRAQIELAMAQIPQVSHVTAHMGCSDMDPTVSELTRNLAKEYGIYIHLPDYQVKRLPGWGQAKTTKDREKAMLKVLGNLEPGTYLFVDHPALDTPETRAAGHEGYYGVASDRQSVTDVFTSKRIKSLIEKKGIELISYKDVTIQ